MSPLFDSMETKIYIDQLKEIISREVKFLQKVGIDVNSIDIEKNENGSIHVSISFNENQ